MHLTRIAALVALPAALSMAACAGGSSATIANVSGNTAAIRIVNGAPGAGSFDVYFQSTGAASPSSPILSALAFGVASDFQAQAAVAGNIIATAAGSPAPSTGARPAASCPVPQFAINAKYSIVFVSQAGALNCELFQDFDYTGAPQYRVHNAARNSALSVTSGFGTIAAASAPPGTPFTVQVSGPQGNSTGSGGPVTFTAAMPQTIAAFSGSITFAVGAATSGTTPALATLDSRYVFAAGGLTQPNSSGALNVAGSAGTSLFALDCSGAAIAPNVACSGGVALVGVVDRL